MDAAPEWSPDGTTIAFSRNCRVALLGLSTGEVQYLTPAHRAYCATDPDWSPDGRKIVFSVGNALVVVTRDGKSRRTIYRWD